VVEMHKTSCAVELEGEEISLFFEVLIEALRLWSEKGFESEEEKAEYQRIVNVVSKLLKPIRETTILSPSYIRTLERLKTQLEKQRTISLEA